MGASTGCLGLWEARSRADDTIHHPTKAQFRFCIHWVNVAFLLHWGGITFVCFLHRSTWQVLCSFPCGAMHLAPHILKCCEALPLQFSSWGHFVSESDAVWSRHELTRRYQK